VTNLNVKGGPKRVELLRELLQSATLIAKGGPRAATITATRRDARPKAYNPERGADAALVLPACNTEAMQVHLDEIATKITPGAHATSPQHQRCSCPHSPHGWLRYADPLRRPCWCNGQP